MNAKNVDKTIKFYENVFGWKLEKWDGPIDYWLIMTGNEDEPGIDGGLSFEEEGVPSVVNTVDVENVEEIIKKIVKNGGEIVRPKHAVPGVGWLAYFKDIEGILTGVMQKDPYAK